MGDPLTSPVMVGRERELGVLEAALEATGTGAPSVVILSGDAGVGKTRLIEEFLTRVGREAVLPLTGACIQLSEGALPYAPLTEALRDLARIRDGGEIETMIGTSLSQLSPLMPEWDLGQEPSYRPPHGETARSRLFELFLSLLSKLGEEQPVILVVEDLQWSDVSTRDLLAFLVHNLRAHRVLPLLSYRTDELHPLHPMNPWLTNMRRERAVNRVELNALDRPATMQLLRNLDPIALNQEILAEIAHRSEGNPLFAEELVAAISRGQPDGLSETLKGLLLSRVHSLADEHRRLLRVAAVAGRRVSHRLLAAVARIPEPDITAALHAAVNRHLLTPDAASDSFTFRHALVREVAYQDLLPVERRSLHAAIAAVLSDRPDLSGGTPAATAAELAYHYYEAHDAKHALSAVVDAGLAAERVYAFAEAERHFARALDLWDVVPEEQRDVATDKAAILERAGEAADQAGNGRRAVTLFENALEWLDESSDSFRAGLLYARLGRLLLWVIGDGNKAVGAQRHAVALLSDQGQSGARARALAELSLSEAICGSVDAATSRAEEAIAMARSIGAPAEEGLGLGALSVATRISAQADNTDQAIAYSKRALQLAEEASDPQDLGRAYMMHSESLGVSGRLDEGIATALEGAAVMRGVGLERTHASFLVLNAAQFALTRDRWSEATELIEQALDKSTHSFTRVYALSLRAHLAIRKGTFGVARSSLEEARGMVGTAAWVQILDCFYGAEAALAVWNREFDEARAAVSNASQTVVRRDPYYAAPLCSMGVRAEAERAAISRTRRSKGDLVEARDMAARLLDQARAFACAPVPETRAHEAMCRAEFSRLEGRSDPAIWEEAARRWEVIGCGYWTSYSRWRQGEGLLVARSSPKFAADLLRSAHDEARRLSAAPLVAEIEGLARRARVDLVARPHKAEKKAHSGGFGLTQRELEVLELLADGHTNKDIAAALFISRKTAAVHVSNILTKLDASGRVEAAGIAIREGLVRGEAPQGSSRT